MTGTGPPHPQKRTAHQSMHLLAFLERPKGDGQSPTSCFEYRLLCSGELYSSSVATTDWRKSDGTRLLLLEPFFLAVCSERFNDFPQELLLRFLTSQVKEEHGNSVIIFHADEDIAADLSALLTLLCRRLITVSARVRQVYSDDHKDSPFRDWSIGFVKALERTHWQQKPSSVTYDSEGRPIDIKDYNPPPLGIDRARLGKLLVSFPRFPNAPSMVLSARLYALALMHLEHDADLAYQLLIASVEATASELLKDYQPTEEQMISSKASVMTKARGFGLTAQQSRELAIEACKGIPWAQRKFVKFLVDYADDSLWQEDDLFTVPPSFLPSKPHFEQVLGDVYQARGKLTHGGHPFPRSAVIGVGSTVPARALMSFDWSDKPFPPVVWFERVVSVAFKNLIERSSAAIDAP